MITKAIIQQPLPSDNNSQSFENINSGTGDISSKGNMRISGIFSGRLNLTGTLTLGVDSRFTGEVVVNDLIVFGKIVGTARVSNIVVFHNSSVFSGALKANEAVVYNGSIISGERNIGRVREKDSTRTNRDNLYSSIIPAPDDLSENKAPKISESTISVIVPSIPVAVIPEDVPKTFRTLKYSIEDPTSIPDEMTHSSS